MHRSSLLGMLALALLSACGQGFAEGDEKSLHGDARRPPEEFATSTLQSPLSSGSPVLYLNFDGASLKYGDSSSRGNTTWLVPKGKGLVAFPSFSTSSLGNMDRASAIQQIVDAVKKDYAAYDLTVTTTRPAAGDYTMVVIGGRPSLIDEDTTTAGISPLDEKNANRNDIVLVFAGILDTIHDIATCVSHEGGHSYGLDHLKPKTAIMYPVLQTGSLKFMPGYTYDDNLFEDEPSLLLAALGAHPTSAQPPPQPQPTAQGDGSAFVSQVVPAAVDAGATFPVKLTFKNSGSTTWTQADGYAVVAQDLTFGGNRLTVGPSVSVAPGSQYTFGFEAKAPSAPGTYTFQWQTAKGTAAFGAKSPAVSITVRAVNAAAQKPPTGAFEAMSATLGKGWAFDSDAPTAAVKIDVYLDGNYLGYITANRSRADLVSSGKTPDASLGFAFSLPGDVAAGKHTVECYGVDDTDGFAYKIGATRTFTK